MNFDIYYEKKLYNTMLDILKEKKILKFFSVLPIQKYFKLPMIKLPMPRLPKSISMSKPKNIETVLQNDIQKINMNEKIVETNSMLEGYNKYIVFIRKHGGLMDEYGLLNLTQLYKSGNIKKSILPQFGRMEIDKYLYNSGYIILNWSSKLLRDTQKWKVLRFDYIFDELNRNMFGKVNKELIREKIDNLLNNKSYYIQHTENWIGTHSIKKTIEKYCKETSTSYRKCKIVKAIK